MKVTEAAAGVYAVQGSAVNWTLLTDGDAVTLVDAGYPGDHDDVLASLSEIGRRLSDVEAVLVTHAHIDHIGSLPRLLEQHTMPVLTSTTEARHVRREHLEQAGTADVVKNLWRPRVLPWALHIMRKGAMNDRGVPSAVDFGSADVIDVPGRPTPLPTPGHTSGHTGYLVPSARVLLTGDALVTGHRLSAGTGSQRLMGMFHHDLDAMDASLDVIAEVDADAIIPGHGPVFPGSPREAVAELRRA
jgi:glyoxylase-like metal-dependent hydrolase (beta-lactamase superfamily II)